MCQLLLKLKLLAEQIEKAAVDSFRNEEIDQFEEGIYQQTLMDATKKLGHVSRALHVKVEDVEGYPRNFNAYASKPIVEVATGENTSHYMDEQTFLKTLLERVT